MKKVILGIVLFAQFTYGMEREFEPSESRSTNTTTLVSSRFFQESEARFRTHLESVLRSVTEGSITPESAIGRARAQAEQDEIPELVTERQVDRTSRRFSEQLDEIKREVQESRRTLEEAFERTQEKYGDNIDALIGNLQDRYEDILAGVTAQYNERRERIEEAYEQQKALMQRMIDEVAAINLKLEKERELESRISHVFIANPSLKPEKITVRSSDVDNIADIFLKHDTVQKEYIKFTLFSELYGNEDLGITATLQDLAQVKEYVNATHISPKRAIRESLI